MWILRVCTSLKLALKYQLTRWQLLVASCYTIYTGNILILCLKYPRIFSFGGIITNIYYKPNHRTRVYLYWKIVKNIRFFLGKTRSRFVLDYICDKYIEIIYLNIEQKIPFSHNWAALCHIHTVTVGFVFLPLTV